MQKSTPRGPLPNPNYFVMDLANLDKTPTRVEPLMYSFPVCILFVVIDEALRGPTCEVDRARRGVASLREDRDRVPRSSAPTSRQNLLASLPQLIHRVTKHGRVA